MRYDLGTSKWILVVEKEVRVVKSFSIPPHNSLTINTGNFPRARGFKVSRKGSIGARGTDHS
jgi:hypothetical protein